MPGHAMRPVKLASEYLLLGFLFTLDELIPLSLPFDLLILPFSESAWSCPYRHNQGQAIFNKPIQLKPQTHIHTSIIKMFIMQLYVVDPIQLHTTTLCGKACSNATITQFAQRTYVPAATSCVLALSFVRGAKRVFEERSLWEILSQQTHPEIGERSQLLVWWSCTLSPVDQTWVHLVSSQVQSE